MSKAYLCWWAEVCGWRWWHCIHHLLH
jgi:hypothetical protein